MRVVLQRVKNANVKVNNKVVGQVGNGLPAEASAKAGFLLLLGVGRGDSEKQADWLVDKILSLRLFPDSEQSDLSTSSRQASFLEKNIQEIGGEILVISQFTLFGDCKKGTRPSFSDAAPPETAEKLYDYFVEKLKQKGIKTETGEFAAKMEVELVNDGPVTLILEK